MVSLERHLKLALREWIVNWNYIDTIIFLVILLIFLGISDPCERCMINDPVNGQMTCTEKFTNEFIDKNLDNFELNLSHDLDYPKAT